MKSWRQSVPLSPTSRVHTGLVGDTWKLFVHMAFPLSYDSMKWRLMTCSGIWIMMRPLIFFFVIETKMSYLIEKRYVWLYNLWKFHKIYGLIPTPFTHKYSGLRPRFNWNNLLFLGLSKIEILILWLILTVVNVGNDSFVQYLFWW